MNAADSAWASLTGRGALNFYDTPLAVYCSSKRGLFLLREKFRDKVETSCTDFLFFFSSFPFFFVFAERKKKREEGRREGRDKIKKLFRSGKEGEG